MSPGGLDLLRPVAIALLVGTLVIAGVGKLLHLGPGSSSGDRWHRIGISGSEADAGTMNAIASKIAGRPVTVTCRDGLAAEGHAGATVTGSNATTLDRSVCVDLGHFGQEPASEIACAESNPRALCGGTINQVLNAMATLAHESVHLFGEPNEAAADCYSRQMVAEVAEGFGAPRPEAHALLHYFNDHFTAINHPPPEYVSAECRPGGQLDLRPETPSWPD